MRPSRFPRVATAILALTGALVLTSACGDGGTTGPPEEDDEEEMVLQPAVLNVAYIARLPRIEPPDTLDPVDAGWPEPGSEVTWVGHLFNSGEETADSVGYVWRVDGETVHEGAVTLPPGETTVSLSRAWPTEREQISLELTREPTDEQANHFLSVRSDALAVQLWMEQRVADWMVEHPSILPFPAWAGQEVRAWNRVLESYRPFNTRQPPEILDRIRLDRLEILPTGTEKWPVDRLTGDVKWYIDCDDGLCPGKLAFDDFTMILHELLHGRGVTDLYAYAVYHEGEASWGSPRLVRIREPDGTLAAGGARMPFGDSGNAVPRRVFQSPYRNRLMGIDYKRPTIVDPHTAYGLNKMAGRRTMITDEGRNAFIPPGTRANDYVWDMPDSVRLRITVLEPGAPSEDGSPAPEGALVEAFYDHSDAAYGNDHGPDPDQVVEVGADGTATLSTEGLWTPGEYGDASVVILRVTAGSEWGYAFLPEYELNLLYIEGAREVGELDIEVEVR